MQSPAAPLDTSVLRPYTQGDANAEREIFVQFRDATRADYGTLRAAVATGDAAGIAAAAHRLKGSSRMMGALPQGNAAESIESSARNGDASGLATALAAFEAEHARLLAWLDGALGRTP